MSRIIVRFGEGSGSEFRTLCETSLVGFSAGCPKRDQRAIAPTPPCNVQLQHQKEQEQRLLFLLLSKEFSRVLLLEHCSGPWRQCTQLSWGKQDNNYILTMSSVAIDDFLASCTLYRSARSASNRDCQAYFARLRLRTEAT